MPEVTTNSAPLAIFQYISEHAAQQPDAPALHTKDKSLTFGELDAWSNRLSHLLAKKLANNNNNDRNETELKIGLCLNPTLEAVIALIAIQKIGAAYVALDPTYPNARIAFMASDNDVTLIITSSGLLPPDTASKFAEKLILFDNKIFSVLREFPSKAPEMQAGEDGLLNVLYTSGSTGQPKGVLGTHKAAINRFKWMWAAFPFEARECCIFKTALNFVDHVWELFGPLCKGIPVVIATQEDRNDPRAMVELIIHYKVTRIVLVPSLLISLLGILDHTSAPALSQGVWTTSGEAFPLQLLQRFQRTLPEATLLNLYGSTEVAGDVTFVVLSPRAPTDLDPKEPMPPIGQPVPNCEVHILNPVTLEPTAKGEVGELFVTGANLARGYHNNDEQNQTRFLTIGQPPQRAFRTGDFGRVGLVDGHIYFVGRQDQQVKIRGHRVELSSVEATLKKEAHLANINCKIVIVTRTSDSGLTQLIAFVTPGHTSTLQTIAHKSLPAYMRPFFSVIDEFPYLPNGKIDRSSLIQLAHSSSFSFYKDSSHDSRLPQSELEQEVAAVLEEVLALPSGAMGVGDVFTDFGGDSVMAALALEKMARCLGGVRLTMKDFLRCPTIEGICGLLSRQKEGDANGANATAETSRCKESRPKIELPKGFVVRAMEASDCARVVELVSVEFVAREPLVAATNISAQDFAQWFAPVCEFWQSQGLCLVAVDTDGLVVGCELNEDFFPPTSLNEDTKEEEEEEEEEPPPDLIMPCLMLLDSMESRYKKEFAAPPGKVLHNCVVSAQPTTPPEVSLALEEQTIDMARERGFEKIVSINVNTFFRYLAVELGYRTVYTTQFVDFEFQGAKVFGPDGCAPVDLHLHDKAVLAELTL